MIAVSVLYGAWSLYEDYRMFQNGQQLSRDVEAEQLTDPTRSGPNGRNFRSPILRLCYCTDRAKW